VNVFVIGIYLRDIFCLGKYNKKMTNFVNTNGYVEFSNPVSVTFHNNLYPRSSMTKTMFSNNAGVYYKNHSLSTGSGGTVNSGVKARRT
jgi:hypothetical protein